MTEEDLTYKLITGEIVKNHRGTFYFIEPGNWVDGKYLIWAKLHRIDGPAVELADGHKEWHRNGRLHRKDGPAVESANGTKYWYLNGEPLTEEQFSKNQINSIQLNE